MSIKVSSQARGFPNHSKTKLVIALAAILGSMSAASAIQAQDDAAAEASADDELVLEEVIVTGSAS